MSVVSGEAQHRHDPGPPAQLTQVPFPSTLMAPCSERPQQLRAAVAPEGGKSAPVHGGGSHALVSELLS